MCECVCVYVCMYEVRVYVCVCVYVCMYVCMILRRFWGDEVEVRWLPGGHASGV